MQARTSPGRCGQPPRLLGFGDVKPRHQSDALPRGDELDHRAVVVDVDAAGDGELDRFVIVACAALEANDLGSPSLSVEDEWKRFELLDVVAVDVLAYLGGKLEVDGISFRAIRLGSVTRPARTARSTRSWTRSTNRLVSTRSSEMSG